MLAMASSNAIFCNNCMLRISSRLLETLDVAYNYFSHDDAFLPVIHLPRLLSLLLYGNPLLGPTGRGIKCKLTHAYEGEDALGIYIEALIAEATHIEQENRTLEVTSMQSTSFLLNAV